MRTFSAKQRNGLLLFLLFFAVLKLGLWGWWRHDQTQTAVSAAQGCDVAGSGCPFLTQATFRLIGVGGSKTPFAAEARGVPDSVRQISVSFQMADMDMGFNRFDLHRSGGGVWLLEGIVLPFCIHGRHDWIVQWQADGQFYRAPFQTRAD